MTYTGTGGNTKTGSMVIFFSFGGVGGCPASSAAVVISLNILYNRVYCFLSFMVCLHDIRSNVLYSVKLYCLHKT